MSSYDWYPPLAKTPIESGQQKALKSPFEIKEDKQKRDIDYLNNMRKAIEGRLSELREEGLYPEIKESDSQEERERKLEQVYVDALQKAEDGFKQQAKTPTRQELARVTHNWAEKLIRDQKKKVKAVSKKVRDEISDYNFITGEDLIGTDEQNAAWADPTGTKTWYYTTEQSKRKLLRELSGGFVDPVLFGKLAAKIQDVGVEEILDDDDIPEAVKERLKYFITQPYQGPPKREPVPETWMQWLAGTLPVVALAAPSRGTAGWTASFLEGRRKAGWNRMIREQGSTPTLKDLQYIDEPDTLAKQRGLAQMPQKWILGKGVRKGKRIVYPDKRPNPEYEKELKFRMGAGPARPESREVETGRTLGLTPDQVGELGYDLSLGGTISRLPRAFGAAWDAFLNDPTAPKLVDELQRVRESFEIAATRNIEGLDLDDPRRSRYFGESDKHRDALAYDIALAQFGQPVTAEEYQASVDGYIKEMDEHYAVRSKEEQERTKDFAMERATRRFEGRKSEEQFLEAAQAIRKNYPKYKMMEDMIRLDTMRGEISSPELTELMHMVILDPLWVVGPVKAVKAAAWAAGKVKIGYGYTKAGRLGEFPAKVATKAGETGTAIVEFAPSAARGMRLGVIGRAEKATLAADEAQVLAAQAANDVQAVTEKIYRLRKPGDPVGPTTPKLSAEIDAARKKAVAAGRAAKKARSREATARRIAKVPLVFDEVQKTWETGYQKLSEAVRHFTRADRDYNHLGDLADDIRMMSRAADDAGHGAQAQLRALGDDILNLLSKGDTERSQAVLHQILTGEFKAMFEGADAVLKPSEAMKELLKNPKMDAAKQLDILVEEAVRTQYLPEWYREIPGKVRVLADEYYKLAKKHGQLRMIKDGIIGTAEHVSGFVARRYKDTTKIHNDVIGLGLRFPNGKEVEHLGDAAALINPKYHVRSADLNSAIKKVVGPGERVTMTNAVEKAEDLMSKEGFKNISDAWEKLGLSEAEIMMLNEVRAPREAIAKVARAQGIEPEQFFREIASVRRAMDDVDYLGHVNLNQETIAGISKKGATRIGKKVLKKVTGKTAIERKPLGDLYYWLRNPLRQFEAHIKDVSTRAGTTAEIKELGKVYGVNNVAGVLSDSAMIKISPLGIAETGTAKAERIRELESIWTTHHGIHMVALSPKLSRDVAKTLLWTGTKISDDPIAIVPKVVANRLENMLLITPAAKQTGLYKGIQQFRDYVVRPANTIFRVSATVLRSGSFHTVNYHGGVGLSSLGLGVGVLNPKLQAAAHRVAFSAAFGGSEIAQGLKMMLPRSPAGEVIALGDALKILEKYGVMNTGMMRYGLDISSGKGLLSVPANLLSRSSRKFKFQQTAEFADNYQKAVLFLGHLRSTSPKDIYRSLDFVAEYGQNWNRMTPFEKGAMRDTFTFYTWNRYIQPHLMMQMYKNPNRLQNFERIKNIVEYNNRYERPETGMGTPAWAWMQGAMTAPSNLQPKPGEAGSHEYTMMMMEAPMSSASVWAGGFHGESPIHAQLGPVPRAIMIALTGGDYGSGHAWEKEFRMPDFTDAESPGAIMDYLYDFNDSRIGRWTVNMIPFGAAFLNCIKLYHKNGMYAEAGEMFARHKCARDFQGLDWAIAPMFGMKPLSTPPFIEIGGVKIPHLGAVRPYTVRPVHTATKRVKAYNK